MNELLIAELEKQAQEIGRIIKDIIENRLQWNKTDRTYDTYTLQINENLHCEFRHTSDTCLFWINGMIMPIPQDLLASIYDAIKVQKAKEVTQMLQSIRAT